MKDIFRIFTIVALLTLQLPFAAASNQSLSIDMQKLCERADIDFTPAPEVLKNPSTDPLFSTIELGGGYEQVAKVLGKRSPDSIASVGDITPLTYAAMTGNWQAGLVFLNAGANINHYSSYLNESILGAAIYQSKFSFACKLIQHGAHLPSSKTERGRLLISSLTKESQNQSGAITFLNYLLQQGFDADESSSSLETPLMAAISLNNALAVKILPKHGARLDIVKKDGRTAWTVAKEKNNPQVLKLLKEAQKKAKPQKRQPAALVPATV